MKIKLILILIIVSALLVGCNIADVNDNASTGNDTAKNISATYTSAPLSEAVENSEDTEESYVTIFYGGKEYAQSRKAVWLDDFDLGMSFKYVGEIAEKLPSGSTLTDELTGIGVPKDTPVYVSEDLTCIRVVFGGVSYYCDVREDTTEENWAIPPALVYNGKTYRDKGAATGDVWEFELDESWKFAGCVRSVVYGQNAPKFELETTYKHLGLPVYYNEETDTIAILEEDDNYAYSDIDWNMFAPVEWEQKILAFRKGKASIFY